MSRSLGARSFMRSPPMRSSPSEMSSSPAIMFRVVDFPQPDGPTRMMNSPSATSMLTSSAPRVPSGYRLYTWSRTMSAIGLSLHCAGGQPGDDPALEEQHEDDDRNGEQHGRGRDRPGRLGELGGA